MNVHYLPAGATKLGSAVHVGYEYDGKTYVGPLTHVGRHAVHVLPRSRRPATTPSRSTDAWDGHCRNCHADANGDPKNIRLIRTGRLRRRRQQHRAARRRD